MLAACAANATYLAGLEAVLPAGSTCIVAGTGGPLAAMLRRADVVATTLDEHPDVVELLEGRAFSGGVVLGAAPVAELLEELGCDAVLPFKSGPRLWEAAEWMGLRVLAAPHRLTRQLENKLALPEIAAAADARIPDSVVVRLDDELVAAARAGDVHLPRVFQTAVGFAGEGTVLVRDADDVAALVADLPGGAAVGKLVEFVDGEPVTVNGVVIPPGTHGAGEEGVVLVGMVARQLTGVAGLTPTDFGSCGNDWTSPPSRPAIAGARSLAHRIGDELAARGFAGGFGIDVVLPADGGPAVLIEINPRWTASLALQVQLQAAEGLPTLLDAHLAAFGWHLDDRPPLSELLAAYGPGDDAGCVRGTRRASTVIAYNVTADDVRIDPGCEPGVWRATPAPDGRTSIERVRDGWRLADLAADDEFVLLVPGTVRPVPPGGSVARVVLRGAAAKDGRARELLEPVRELLHAVVDRTTVGD